MKKYQRFIQFFAIIGILIFANIILSGYFKRIDLTKEKRYTLSDLTKSTMDSLKFPMHVKVFLEGEFPAPVKRLAEGVRTTLYEMQQYDDNNYLQFEFINPSDNKALYQDFMKHGLQPVPINLNESMTKQSMEFIFPFAVVTYKGRDEYIDLVRNATYPNGAINLKKAEANIEANLVSSMRRLMRPQQPLIGIVESFGTYYPDKFPDVFIELKNMYRLLPVSIDSGQQISPSFDVLVIPQPDTAFTERAKYELDQYIMRGGKILWVMDQQKVNLQNGPSLTKLRDLNLDDFFFNYGFKVNHDLIEDMNCGNIDVIAGMNNGPVFQSIKYIYYPLTSTLGNHPITKNVNLLLYRYASSIDTMHQAGIKKTVLVKSSNYSRDKKGTIYMNLNEIIGVKKPKKIYHKQFILGLHMQGKFKSLFQNRQAPLDSAAPNLPTAKFIDSNVYPTQMVVLSDGQLMMGIDVRGKTERAMPFDNKALILNSIAYMVGSEELEQIETKAVEYRRLDILAVENREMEIRMINIVLPIVVVLIFGVIRFYLRKRKNKKLHVNV